MFIENWKESKESGLYSLENIILEKIIYETNAILYSANPHTPQLQIPPCEPFPCPFKSKGMSPCPHYGVHNFFHFSVGRAGLDYAASHEMQAGETAVFSRNGTFSRFPRDVTVCVFRPRSTGVFSVLELNDPGFFSVCVYRLNARCF